LFELDENLCFVNIDNDYLKHLNAASSEVQYQANNYDYKPHVGILVNNNNREYVIPLTSAKQKHKDWKNINQERYLIYEYAEKINMGQYDIWVYLDESDPNKGVNDVKHILAAMDIRKMIPIKDDVYTIVDLNENDTDNDETIKYKNLLNKEYIFCLKIKDSIVKKASNIYDKQLSSGKIQKFCCDFKALETACDDHR